MFFGEGLPSGPFCCSLSPVTFERLNMPERSSQAATRKALLVKEHLARALKDAIVQGRLKPGQRVIEGLWAKHFAVAQASVREAINLLIADGFLTKDSGRSARVTRYSEEDVSKLYALRAALEGMAAQLVAERGLDLAPLEEALNGMKAAIQARDMRALVESDLAFHSCLCEMSGNHFLADAARRVLSPLFAFVLLEVLASGQGPEAWSVDLPRHARIIELIREGDPLVSGQYVHSSIRRFVSSAYAVWENVGGSVQAHAEGKPKPPRTGRQRGQE